MATFFMFDIYALMQTNQQVSSGAVIKAVGIAIYEDSACSTPLTHLDWGWIDSPSSNTYVAYIKNEANYPTELSITFGPITPSNKTAYITRAWNATGVQLAMGEVATVLFTLNVTSSCPVGKKESGSLFYNMTITGTAVD